MSYLLPYLISFGIGYLLISVLFAKKKNIDFFLHLFLAAGLGLAVSAEITFYSYVLFDRLNTFFVIFSNLAVLLGLITWRLFLSRAYTTPILDIKNIAPKDILAVGFLGFISFSILVTYANFYPLGGWDAWSCWNLKSKFLFLADSSWKNMFSPILWRSSPHYPLLLPLANVWGWIWQREAAHIIPLANSIIFTFLTLGLLFCGLRQFIKTGPAVLGPLLILMVPFAVKLTTSQYCDIIFAYFLLAAFLCLLLSKAGDSRPLALLAGVFLGLLSFTKSEGTASAAVISLLSVAYLFSVKKGRGIFAQTLVVSFLAGLFFSALSTVIFQLQFAPANQTFINGLTSPENPSHFRRFGIIFVFFLFEITSKKWGWVWLLILTGVFLGWRRCFNRQMIIFPLYVLCYGLVVVFYYFLNTYFEILWWLSVTLNRLLFSLLPAMVFWVFYGLFGPTESEKENLP